MKRQVRTALLSATILILAACGCSEEGPKIAEPTFLGSPAPTLPFVVCTSNNSWKPPSRIEQATRLLREPNRFAGFDAAEQAKFDSHFWMDTGSASAGVEHIVLSGLWVLRLQNIDVDVVFRCPLQPNESNPRLLNLWLRAYEATRIDYTADRLIVSISATTDGFQVIQVTSPVTLGAGRIDFVGPSGNRLESIQPPNQWSVP